MCIDLFLVNFPLIKVRGVLNDIPLTSSFILSNRAKSLLKLRAPRPEICIFTSTAYPPVYQTSQNPLFAYQIPTVKFGSYRKALFYGLEAIGAYKMPQAVKNRNSVSFYAS